MTSNIYNTVIMGIEWASSVWLGKRHFKLNGQVVGGWGDTIMVVWLWRPRDNRTTLQVYMKNEVKMERNMGILRDNLWIPLFLVIYEKTTELWTVPNGVTKDYKRTNASLLANFRRSKKWVCSLCSKNILGHNKL